MPEKVEPLLTEMEYYCRERQPAGALLLTGEWGGGKTYFVVNRLQPRLKDSHIFIRISLFGIRSTTELQTSIKKKWLEAIADYMAKSKIDVGIVFHNSRFLAHIRLNIHIHNLNSRPMSSLGQHFSQISILEVLPHPAANP